MQSYRQRDIKDYIGKKYGHLTVIGKAPEKHIYSNSFLFQCDCGNVVEEQPARVVTGHKSSCGKCSFKGTWFTPKFNSDDYIGRKKHMLTVISVADKKPEDKRWRLRCKCDCGRFTEITPDQFNRGVVKSCGCLKCRNGSTVDGKSKHPLYGIWNQMILRCYNPKSRHYNRYGGRGITVCDEWRDFWNFVKWSDSIGGRTYGMTIDRINNDGNYCPDNCRWITQAEQNLNKSSNVVIEYNGKSQTLTEWARETGLTWQAISHRYHRGWSVERMLTTPMQYHRKQSEA